jgi:DNA-binding NtrC family response regulator
VAQEGKAEWEKVISYLKNKKISVHTVYSTQDAYRILKSDPVSMILSDYNLPKANILSFLKKIKSIKSYIEIIFLGEKITLTKAIEAMKEGAYDIYEFPLNLRLLMTVLDKAIEKQSLHVDKMELERKVKETFNLGKLVGRSKSFHYVTEIVRSVAPKNVNILLSGETGTGKEMIASAIHFNSPRASKPFIKVNCGSFNEGVLESELFGHEKGAFTGAIAKRLGRFELAHGGTIFLDEIGDIFPSTQIKLLRVLQEKQFERVGGNETITVDVRVIAASNKDLKKLIEENKFREDLFYRLNVVRMELPSLRERKDDIPLLVSHFINKLNEEKGYQIKGITKEAMQILHNYIWPGNVRELENALESSMALAERNVIEAKYLPSFLLLTRPQDTSFYQLPKNMTLPEIEKEVIKMALEKTGGNKSRAAKCLGIGLRTLQRKAKDL